MKFPSTLTRPLRSRDLSKRIAGGVLAAFIFAAGAFAAGAFAENTRDADAIALLGLSLGGYDLAVAAWTGITPSEKQTLRDQAVRITRLAQAAELDGLASSPEVALTLRWATSSFLADAWEKKIASETDLSESAARSFYEANRPRYLDADKKPMPFNKDILPRLREDMVAAAVEKRLALLSDK